jgi:hypothetical protein
MDNPVFKIDNNEVKIGQDFRIEYTVNDKASMIVVVTNEGVIIDWYLNGNCVQTMSQTFDEMTADLQENADWVE